jgi:alpha-tubulin suppressor-like RCC1 family protein
MKNITQISAGYDSSMLLNASGNVFVFGDNVFGEMGIILSKKICDHQIRGEIYGCGRNTVWSFF